MIKKISTFLLAFVLFFCVILSIFSVTLNSTVLDPSSYSKAVVTDVYINELKTQIAEVFERDLQLYEVNYKKLLEHISTDELKSLSIDAINKIAKYIIYKTDYELTPFEDETIKDIIKTDLENYASKNDLIIEKNAVNDVYNAVTQIVTINIGLTSKSILGKIPDVSRLVKICNFWFLPVIILITCAFGIIFINRKKLGSSLYSTATPLWVGSAAVFIPTIMLIIYNFPSRLALEQSPLKMFIVSIFNSTLTMLTLLSSIMIALSTTILILSIFLIVHKKNEV